VDETVDLMTLGPVVCQRVDIEFSDNTV